VDDFVNGPGALIAHEKIELLNKLNEANKVRKEQGRVIDSLQAQNIALYQKGCCCDSHAALAAQKEGELKQLRLLMKRIKLVSDLPLGSFITIDNLIRQIIEINSLCVEWEKQHGQL
jgi:hypothetical protein